MINNKGTYTPDIYNQQSKELAELYLQLLKNFSQYFGSLTGNIANTVTGFFESFISSQKTEVPTYITNPALVVLNTLNGKNKLDNAISFLENQIYLYQERENSAVRHQEYLDLMNQIISYGDEATNEKAQEMTFDEFIAEHESLLKKYNKKYDAYLLFNGLSLLR